MWFDGPVDSTGEKLVRAAALFALWAVAKYYSLVVHVWKPNEYSDTYYYFLQAEQAAKGAGLAAMTPEYPTPAAALLMVPWWTGGTDYDTYRWNFLVLVVAIDAAFALLLAVRTGAGGLLAWTLFETLSGRLALLRFDVIPAILAATALLLILQRRPNTASPFVVAGAAVKLWPVLLFPLALGERRHRLRALAIGAVSASLVIVASVLAAGSERLLSPLTYQRERGLQIESVPATAAMIRRLTDPAYSIFWSQWNAYELEGPTVAAALQLADLAAIVALGVLIALFVRWFLTHTPLDAAGHLALFAIAAFMATSKALSPQYVLWLAAPAAVLLGEAVDPPARHRVRAAITTAWVAMLAVLTAYVYPLRYDEILYANAPRPVLALAARNVLLVGFAAWAAWCAATATPRQHDRPKWVRP